jgi:hypothetical protein
MENFFSPPVGGFLELALEDIPTCPGSIWDAFFRDKARVYTFGNARSGLVWLVRTRQCECLWVPAYICSDVTEALDAAHIKVSFYAVTRLLEPEADAFKDVRPGDAVLTVSYWGKPQPNWVGDELARCGAVHIDDRAQTTPAPWTSPAAWEIYSPRKWVGVFDGGVVVYRGDNPPPPPRLESRQSRKQLEHAIMPSLLRFEMRPQLPHSVYESYQRAEAAMDETTGPMSKTARCLLERIPLEPLCRKRRKNYTILHRMLARYCLWEDIPCTWTPLGFPLVCEQPERVADRLHARNLFVPRHWKSLPSPVEDFPHAHYLSRRLLTIPCDQRMSAETTASVAQLVASVLA